MRKILILTPLLLLSVVAYSQKNMKAQLKEASVFLKGAELTHKASGTLQRGQNEVIVDDLSPYVEQNSIKIKTTNGVTVSAFEFVRNTDLNKEKSPKVKELEDSIKLVDKTLVDLGTKIKVNTDLKDLLEKGMAKNVYQSEKGLPVDEITKSMNYFETKSNEIINNIISAENEIKKINLEKTVLTERLKEVSVAGTSTGSMKLVLTAPLSTSTELTISYYTPMASWTPYYDFNIGSLQKPVKITTRAKVKQFTGMDWNNIKISLSSSIPSFSASAPLFRAWFLEQVHNVYRDISSGMAVAQNSLSYSKRSFEEKKAPAFVGTYYITPYGALTEEQFNELDPNSIKSITPAGESDKSRFKLDPNTKVMIIEFKSETDYVKQEETDLDIVYNISMAYSVPGNGKEQSVDLKEQEIMAEYSYYTAPKLDKLAFLIAEIPNWEKLNLTSGEASITYNDTYVGKTFIGASSTSEKLSLTLGDDKRIAVKREMMKDFTSVKFLGSNKLQVFTYKITVRNNQNRVVRIVTKDQYPLSTNKDYTVELLSNATTKPTVNREDLGVITWEEEFKAGETKVYQISFSVKYPKDTNLNL